MKVAPSKLRGTVDPGGRRSAPVWLQVVNANVTAGVHAAAGVSCDEQHERLGCSCALLFVRGREFLCMFNTMGRVERLLEKEYPGRV